MQDNFCESSHIILITPRSKKAESIPAIWVIFIVILSAVKCNEESYDIKSPVTSWQPLYKGAKKEAEIFPLFCSPFLKGDVEDRGILDGAAYSGRF